ncbi:DUF3352 domain-containing protein [Rivularia sp. UHCC 0363]|uniref:DUF3352 domain-containing protein n=1 Tax=Rivularia sp. UHCC 0363 TaxID=3110244 RepID=UPI002B21B6E6|nr:DUF3352 domain-containing protein [Rivularia sp. UHCC 0363]MEA5593080.1 DUF3352 domain-containing protein [Rivularia sp. UHCC 0363]
MKSLVRVGALATLNLFCCSSFAQAVVANNIKIQSNISQNNVFDRALDQKVALDGFKNRLQSTTTNTQFANFLPSNTPLVAMVDTSSATWKKAGNFQLFQTVWNGISFLIPSQLKDGYATDIEPWLGEQVAFAFLPSDGSSKVTIESNFVTLAPVKDEQSLQPFLSKLKANGSFTQREYKGITILETKTDTAKPGLPETENNSIPPVPKSPLNKAVKPTKPTKLNKIKNKKPNSLVIGILPGHLAVGASTKAIERLINNNQQKAATLAQNAQFQQTIRQPQTDKPLFAMYQDPAGYIAFIKELVKDPSLGLPNFDLDSILSPEQFKQYQSIGSFVTLQEEGVRFQVNTYPSPKFARNSLTPNIQTQTMLSRMPAATYSAVNGENLNQRWQTIATILSSQKELENGLKMFRGFISSKTGLDFDRDIINWMDGEFALFMFPTKGGFFKMLNPNANMGIGLAVETSDRTAAETTLNKLGTLITSVSKGEVKIIQKSIKNQPVTSWDIKGDSKQSLLAYSWVDDKTLIVTTGYGAIADLVPQPYIALPSTYNFKKATNSLPSPNAGYFYMNVGSLLSWIYGFVPSQYSNNEYFNMFKQAVGSVYSVSATTSSNVEREQMDLLFVLAPVRNKIK